MLLEAVCSDSAGGNFPRLLKIARKSPSWLNRAYLKQRASIIKHIKASSNYRLPKHPRPQPYKQRVHNKPNLL